MDDLKKKSEILIEKMKKDRGYIYPEWEFAARNDPDFLEAYNNLYKAGLNEGKALPIKVRELVALGVLAFRGDIDGIKSHILRAMRFGATKEEIFDAIETIIIPGGAPTYFNGLQALMLTLKELEEQNSGKK